MDSNKFACSILLFLLIARLNLAAPSTMPVSTAKVIPGGAHVATAMAKSIQGRKIGKESAPFSRRFDNLSNGHSNDDNNVNHDPREVDEAGYLAFSADYRAPRHHPPENN
ncbi:hypothetical protein ACFE04_023929 [Oxalis oulophora]